MFHYKQTILWIPKMGETSICATQRRQQKSSLPVTHGVTGFRSSVLAVFGDMWFATNVPIKPVFSPIHV